MRVLGIDPGIHRIGYGLIDFINHNNIAYIKSGLFKPPKLEFHTKLAWISRQIEDLLAQSLPEVIAMEEVFVNKNAASSIKLCHARGAIMCAVGKLDKSFVQLAPNTIKHRLTGYGHASKDQVGSMIGMTISGIDSQLCPDQNDALAIAFAAAVQFGASVC